jgi:phage repressor protein C with HTH and peptisase S24 domain
MARRKTLPVSVQAKFSLAERLRLLRSELYGERGGPELARRLGLPIRTWYNYESGVTVPAEVVLKIIELTSVEPMWLLHGEGPKFRAPGSGHQEALLGSGVSVGVLLRTALQMLESDETSRWASQRPRRDGEDKSDGGDPLNGATADPDVALIEINDVHPEPLTRTSGPRYLAARSEWLDAERDCRCFQVVGDAMAPILMDGAYVAFAKSEEPLVDLDGKMVVAWIDRQPVVRWFQYCDKVALLRAQNAATVPNQLLLDLESGSEQRKIRRVLWINTPH